MSFTQSVVKENLDRLPPHSIAAEQGVLGCVFLSPHDCMGECIEKFKSSSVFFDLLHRIIYEVLVEMFDRKEAIDAITVMQKLKDRGTSLSPEQSERFYGLPEKTPSAANLSFYITILREKHALRRCLSTAVDICKRVYAHEGEVDSLIDGIERDVLAISNERAESSTRDIRALVSGTIDKLEQWHAGGGMLSGISAGFPDLDKLTTGLHGGEMIVIAGRPGLGKTSLGMNIAETVAMEQKLPVGVFSLEMSSDSLVLRMLCSRARVNLRKMREGFLSERDFPKITSAAGKLAASPLHIDDTGGLSILQLRARARRMWQQHGIKLFVVDYLQLLHSDNPRSENRQQEIADISSGIKALAKELDVPIIVCAQLNRDTEREKRSPRMSDLRESGAIEQDADLIGLLYRPVGEKEEDLSAEQEAVPVNLLIAKQRNGPAQVDVHLTFLKPYTRFESAAKINEQQATSLPYTDS